MKAGENPLNTIHPSAITDEQGAEAEVLEWLVAHIHNAPTLLVITVDLTFIASMDKDLGNGSGSSNTTVARCSAALGGGNHHAFGQTDEAIDESEAQAG
jgi:hypothetical protein